MKLQDLSSNFKEFAVESVPVVLNRLKIDDQSLRTDDETYRIGTGLDDLRRWGSMSKGMMRELSTPDRDYVLNAMFEKSTQNLTLGIKDGTVVGLYEGHRTLPPIAAMGSCLIQTVPEAEVKSFHSTTEEVLVDLVVPGEEVEPRVGDISGGGMTFYSSLNPEHHTHLTPYINRYVCDNGMTVPHSASRIQLKGQTVEAVIEQMEQLAQTYLGGVVEEHLDTWGGYTNKKLDDPARTASVIMAQHEISARIRDRVLTLIADGEKADTVYDLLNIITGLQHEEGVSSSQRQALMELGGHQVSLGSSGHDVNVCQACHTHL